MSVLAPDSPPAVVDPRYRPHPVRVVRARRLSPSYVRLTLGGADLTGFTACGWDQRIKVVLPADGVRWQDAPADWFGWYRALPEGVRPPMRTYTVRAWRPAAGELDVDFVLHGVGSGEAGPAATWAAAARPGDPVVVIGPSAPGTGRMWGVEFCPPPAARSLLLAGDETAVPAIASVLERLPAGTRVSALLEVPEDADARELGRELRAPAAAVVEWLPREGTGAAHGELLRAAVLRRTAALTASRAAAAAVALEDVDVDAGILWEVPEEAGAFGEDSLYAWLAGEAGVVKELRRHLVREVGVPRECVAFMGYWRRGRSEQ